MYVPTEVHQGKSELPRWGVGWGFVTDGTKSANNGVSNDSESTSGRCRCWPTPPTHLFFFFFFAGLAELRVGVKAGPGTGQAPATELHPLSFPFSLAAWL